MSTEENIWVKKWKKEPWYMAQERTRQFLIQSHATFCCPVTSEILDMRESFILKGRGAQVIISENGIVGLIEKHGHPVVIDMLDRDFI